MSPTSKLFGKVTGPGGMHCPCCGGGRKSRKHAARRVRVLAKRETRATIAAELDELGA